MSSVIAFSPEWLETTHTQQTKNTIILPKNITLEVTEKKLSKMFNEIDIKNIRLEPEQGSLTYKIKNISVYGCSQKEYIQKLSSRKRKERLMEYVMLDSKKYYFTYTDFEEFLDNPKFNIDYCNIYSPFFKNYNKPIPPKNINYLENSIYNKFIDKLEDYYLEINHQDQRDYSSETEDIVDNYYTDSVSSDEEWEIN
jgi:hypothetical protein